ncbi:MAG: 8-oxo-dGTP diphosphatase [Candidatus Roizmanbacteria bacterium]
MNIQDYKKKLKKPMLPRTLIFYVRGNEVLLGHKKRGFGKGKINGIGGKVEKDETIEQGAIREFKEETGVILSTVKSVGVIEFYFPHITDESWNQCVHVFLSSEGVGEPTETEEMLPQWYKINDIPFDLMWDDDKYWLPQVLKGKKLNAEFMFNELLNTAEQNLEFFELQS